MERAPRQGPGGRRDTQSEEKWTLAPAQELLPEEQSQALMKQVPYAGSGHLREKLQGR